MKLDSDLFHIVQLHVINDTICQSFQVDEAEIRNRTSGGVVPPSEVHFCVFGLEILLNHPFPLLSTIKSWRHHDLELARSHPTQKEHRPARLKLNILGTALQDEERASRQHFPAETAKEAEITGEKTIPRLRRPAEIVTGAALPEGGQVIRHRRHEGSIGGADRRDEDLMI